MGPAARTIAPRYVRLSGEIADQTMLDNLHAVYPQAGLGHAYASTEAGVGFEVDDGLEGFPAHFVDDASRDVDIKVVGASLRLRSARTASRYIGAGVPALMDGDGFVDTGDIVERRGERYYFVGRKDGIINVGGLKVHPEEVEAAINRHAGVRGSLVKSRKSPITGAIVVADVVLEARPDGCDAGPRLVALEREIIEACRRDLAPHKVPALIRFVPALPMSAAGKLVRHA
jgi:acyl-coenzyme A synthetase/AMP-(fatty) acid ligase